MPQYEVCAYVCALGIENSCKIRSLVESSLDEEVHMSCRGVASLRMWVV